VHILPTNTPEGFPNVELLKHKAMHCIQEPSIQSPLKNSRKRIGGQQSVAVCLLLGDVAINISIIGVSGNLGLGITFLVPGSMIRSNRSNTI
jgi:hypothetical protein